MTKTDGHKKRETSEQLFSMPTFVGIENKLLYNEEINFSPLKNNRSNKNSNANGTLYHTVATPPNAIISLKTRTLSKVGEPHGYLHPGYHYLKIGPLPLLFTR